MGGGGLLGKAWEGALKEMALGLRSGRAMVNSRKRRGRNSPAEGTACTERALGCTEPRGWKGACEGWRGEEGSRDLT